MIICLKYSLLVLIQPRCGTHLSIGFEMRLPTKEVVRVVGEVINLATRVGACHLLGRLDRQQSIQISTTVSQHLRNILLVPLSA